MEFEQGFLAACAEALQQIEDARPLEPQPRGTVSSLRKRTQAFLTALGYLPPQGAGLAGRDLRRNRLALISLSGWFDRAFQLQMRHAPGAHFFGGQLSPLSFAIAASGDRFLGVAGRGLTLQQAFESCVGEAAERLSAFEWPGDRERPAPGQAAWPAPLQIRAKAAGDPILAGCELSWAWRRMGLPFDQDPRGVDWVEGMSLVDGEPRLLPAALCLRPAAGRPDAPNPAGSAGCAAGASLPAATLAALEEVIERDAAVRWWRGETSPCPVAPELLSRLGLDELGRQVRGDSPRRHWFLDITGDLQVPAFVALSAEPDGRAVVGGYGASLDPRRALTNALLELCQRELTQELALQKRERRGVRALSAADLRWVEQHARVSLDSHDRFRAGGPPRSWSDRAEPRSLAATLSRLADAGYDAYCVDLSRRPLGVKVARVVVPGLETERPDWTVPTRSAITVEACPRAVGAL
ncbi:thiazole/oxazole-forming peptide maturase, SagD family component [Tistlia consotensis]|uniref:Thiazole/oxazole-forming peptide maturase, SagD family component n=1 Tax=Tistlia consotensis USBA 355 TaxID=560819 RepID=A0A1Y6C967_9PROT|nr:YcaO-like family protein [Tistlia consotensis]SMF51308.1 thiazole/oxazole-forming peptide maturase, SagD family component [Tistlia consotensis USBA 355]SNR84461.1 thiazole/oxazole-forming peptide maturase, SagD family component [Tistlia consotensis]